MANEFKKGDVVRFKNFVGRHESYPEFYPEDGTIGTVLGLAVKFYPVLGEDCEDFYIQWPTGATSLDDRWACDPALLELVKEGGEDDGQT